MLYLCILTMYKYSYMYTITMNTKAMILKESKRGHMKLFVGGKRKAKLWSYALISKMKEIIKIYLFFKNCIHFDHIFFLYELLPDHYAFRNHDLLSWANKMESNLCWITSIENCLSLKLTDRSVSLDWRNLRFPPRAIISCR